MDGSHEEVTVVINKPLKYLSCINQPGFNIAGAIEYIDNAWLIAF
jgi:hypothetical protein